MMSRCPRPLLLAAVFAVLAFLAMADASYAGNPPGRFPIEQNHRYGFIDSTGAVAIAPRFVWAAPFHDGLAAAIECGKYGYIDASGAWAIAPKFDAASSFSGGLARASVDGKTGFIDRSGRFAIPARFDAADDFYGNRAAVKIGEKWGYIDHSGGMAVPARFDETLPFAEDLAGVRIGTLWGFVDARGHVAVPPRYLRVYGFSDGRARVLIAAGNSGYIDRAGRLVLPDTTIGFAFSDGLLPQAARSKAEPAKMGYIDVHGHFAIPPQFDDADAFSEDRAAVRIGQKWGYVDPQGRMAIPVQFDGAAKFSAGLAIIWKGDKQGYADRAGRVAVAAQFDEAYDFEGDAAEVSFSDAEWGYIDRTGKVLWRAPQNERPNYFDADPMHGLTKEEMQAGCR